MVRRVRWRRGGIVISGMGCDFCGGIGLVIFCGFCLLLWLGVVDLCEFVNLVMRIW